MDKNFEPLKKAFVKHNWHWQESEELFKCIFVRNKTAMWLYNYNDNVLVERNHPVLMRCRGIVVQEDGKILNYPFDRFFNDFEQERAVIDWKSAEVQEKVDGSLICAFWNNTDWEITTRGSFYPTQSETNFAELFKQRFKHFDRLSHSKCYMFELITKENRIVTWYDEEGIYLLGARNRNNLQELSQKELDDIANELQVFRPRRFKASDMENCKRLFKDFREDEEGIVIVDGKFNRIKLKQESYIKLSKIKMLKEQDIFDYVLGRTTIDQEYLKKLPEVMQTIENIRNQWQELVKKARETFEKLKHKPTRKEFALEAIKYPYKSMLFALLDNQDLNKMHYNWGQVQEWLNTISKSINKL